MIWRSILFAAAVISLSTAIVGCSGESEDDGLVEMDLLSYGVPILIKAPEGSIVESKDLLVQKDVTVRSGSDFSLQIFESDALTRDIGAIRSRMLTEVQSNPYFQEVIEEDENGFIYKTAIDSNYINYGFRHVRLQGDKEYVFQTAMRGKFTLEQVQRMKSAVE